MPLPPKYVLKYGFFFQPKLSLFVPFPSAKARWNWWNLPQSRSGYTLPRSDASIYFFSFFSISTHDGSDRLSSDRLLRAVDNYILREPRVINFSRFPLTLPHPRSAIQLPVNHSASGSDCRPLLEL